MTARSASDLAADVRAAHAGAMEALGADVHPYSATAIRQHEEELDLALDEMRERLEAAEAENERLRVGHFKHEEIEQMRGDYRALEAQVAALAQERDGLLESEAEWQRRGDRSVAAEAALADTRRALEPIDRMLFDLAHLAKRLRIRHSPAHKEYGYDCGCEACEALAEFLAEVERHKDAGISFPDDGGQEQQP